MPAFKRKREDYIVNWTTWDDPIAEDKELFGDQVKAVRKLEMRVPSSHMERLYAAPIQIIQLGLMAQDETSFEIMVRNSYVGSPYAQSHQTWFKWEFITDSVDSDKTALRQQASV